MLRILGKTPSINVRKVLFACDEIGLAYEREDWGVGSRSTSEPEFLALNPKAVVPVIVDGGAVLTESNTIVRYLAAKHGRTDLLPTAPLERARVEQWMDWQATDLNGAWRYAFYALGRRKPDYQDLAAIAASSKEWNDKIALLDAHLAKARTDFVCGDTLTAADIPLGLSVHRWVRTPLEHRDCPAVSAYYARLRTRPAFLKHTGPGDD
jgi:glutathione S-transferase